MKKKTQTKAHESARNDQPFFARLLENQELSEATAGVTLKYPSDNDEYWPVSGG